MGRRRSASAPDRRRDEQSGVQGEPPAARAARRDTLPLDAGDTLELRLRWRQAPPDLRVKAQLVMAAAPLLHWRDSAVEAEAAVDDDGGALVNLNVPATTIPGLYLLRLSTTVGDKPLRAAAAGAEGEVYLGPIRVRRLPERLPATEGNLAQLGDLTLVAITAEDRVVATASGDDPQDAAADKTTGTPAASAGWLPVRITWKAARPLALDHSRTLRLLDPPERCWPNCKACLSAASSPPAPGRPASRSANGSGCACRPRRGWMPTATAWR